MMTAIDSCGECGHPELCINRNREGKPQGGIIQKSSDSAIPLCARHHRTGDDSYHKLGPRGDSPRCIR
jgi:hypothetical protein